MWGGANYGGVMFIFAFCDRGFVEIKEWFSFSPNFRILKQVDDDFYEGRKSETRRNVDGNKFVKKWCLNVVAKKICLVVFFIFLLSSTCSSWLWL